MVNHSRETTEPPEAPARDRILAAARLIFGQYGLAGARLDMVAREAQCTKGLVVHYFGSKKGLWNAVLTYYLGMGESSRFLSGATVPDAHTLDEFLQRTFRFFQTHPDFNALAHRAATEHDAEVPEGFVQLIRRAQSAFALAQEQGLINAQIEAPTGHLMVHLLISGWFSYRDVFARTRGRPRATTDDDQQYFDALRALLQSGLLSRSTDSNNENEKTGNQA